MTEENSRRDKLCDFYNYLYGYFYLYAFHAPFISVHKELYLCVKRNTRCWVHCVNQRQIAVIHLKQWIESQISIVWCLEYVLGCQTSWSPLYGVGVIWMNCQLTHPPTEIRKHKEGFRLLERFDWRTSQNWEMNGDRLRQRLTKISIVIYGISLENTFQLVVVN